MLESEINQIEIAARLNVVQNVIPRLSTRFYQTSDFTSERSRNTIEK